VGSDASNQALSERRAESLRQVLVREFRVPARALETVGYGEQYLLVNTPYENWENRRVTLRRVDEFLR
jgi:outer membrane protein OmpA-like peptidoglycan-associated protein